MLPPPPPAPVDDQAASLIEFLDWLASNPPYRDLLPIIRYAHEHPTVSEILAFAQFTIAVRAGKREKRADNMVRFQAKQDKRFAEGS